MLRLTFLSTLVIATLFSGLQANAASGNLATHNGSSSVLLTDGRTLVSGGGAFGPSATAKIIDQDGSMKAVAAMREARSGHASTLLRDGRVLVTGGVNANGTVATAEIYNPAENKWSWGGFMALARSGQSTFVLKDGRVLIAGGAESTMAEVFDPYANRFVAVGSCIPALAGSDIVDDPITLDGHVWVHCTDGVAVPKVSFNWVPSPGKRVVPEADRSDYAAQSESAPPAGSIHVASEAGFATVAGKQAPVAGSNHATSDAGFATVAATTGAARNSFAPQPASTFASASSMVQNAPFARLRTIAENQWK